MSLAAVVLNVEINWHRVRGAALQGVSAGEWRCGVPAGMLPQCRAPPP